ncbi:MULTISPECIES: hypothetical protein [unclassified Schlesneria]|uniref:hypothetical protein n=1 Tax=Schlesneria TaxID=656899 RepID=UPI002EE5F658
MPSTSDLVSEDAATDQPWLGTTVPSLLPAAWDEIERHKWIESEKARRDVGQAAVADWLKRFWWRFCRWRRIEHVEGVCRWYEFSHQDFAKLMRPIFENDRLMLVILELMKTDRRRVMNDLEVIEWARDAGVPMERVIEILTEIHINVARLDPPVEWVRRTHASLSNLTLDS